MPHDEPVNINLSLQLDRRPRCERSQRQARQLWLSLAGLGIVSLALAFISAHVFDPSPLTHLPDGLEVRRDVPYGNHKYHKLDIVSARDRVLPRPAIVMIHEGAWMAGDKSSYHSLMAEYAQLGYVTASIDFRPSTVARFPAAVEDCRRAVRWLRMHASEFGIDPKRIGVMGYSSGAHLAMMLALDDQADPRKGAAPDSHGSSRVQAAVCVSGVYDLLLEEKGDFPNDENDPAVVQFLGGAPRQQRDLARRASPVAYLSPDDPPLLVLHGEVDRRIDVEQARQFALALRAIGRQDRVILLPEGHGIDVLPRDPRQRRLVRTFFARHLRPDPPP